MSADRELLELAAKAIGMVVLTEGEPWPREKVGWFFNQAGGNPPALHDRSSRALNCWAPLTDDGDALRLAVALGLYLEIDRPNGRASALPKQEDLEFSRERFGRDPCAAMRRAIVRAAAELAKIKAMTPPADPA